MGQDQIRNKLIQEFEKHLANDLVMSEKDVVYCFVELRKLIDHQAAKKDYPAIKFYADWSVHIQKNYIPYELKELLSQENIDNFIDMENLRIELNQFLNENLIKHHYDNEDYWNRFRANLIRVLSEQPLLIEKEGRSLMFTSDDHINRIEFTYT